jgi:hypothetical protein
MFVNGCSEMMDVVKYECLANRKKTVLPTNKRITLPSDEV